MQRKVLLISLVSVLTLAIQAQSVSLDSCRSWARANYPTVRQYELVQKSEQYSVSNAARAWIPQSETSLFLGIVSWPTATNATPIKAPIALAYISAISPERVSVQNRCNTSISAP